MKAELLKKFQGEEVTIAVPHQNYDNRKFWYSGRVTEFDVKEKYLILARETELVRIEFDEILSIQLKRQ